MKSKMIVTLCYTNYGFAHAKIKKTIFYPKELGFLGDIDIILNDFQSWLYSSD